ncbi:MAG: glycoside hydrolase family 26 protein [Bacteroides sp.]|nr:glycoside hydrolase family 26 protein [Bacteroides sp.]
MKNIFKLLILFTMFPSCTGCGNQDPEIPETPEARKPAKYEPEEGQCFVFISQDLEAVGGLPDYNQGYCDHFATPAGITVYLGMGGDGDHVSGLYEVSNWGSGDCCANKYPLSNRFDNSMIAIGLAMVGQEEAISSGKQDAALDKIGEWIRNMAPHPVFLRIGYEFDGFDWNHYIPATYIPAYKYIKDRFDAAGIDNIAYVWQSKGDGTPISELDKWYPGNDYVDWCAYSYFGKPDKVMIEYACRKGKPVFIAEATPVFQEGDTYFDADINKPETAQRIWDEWFTGFFKVIEENGDVIKAFSYINIDWLSQPMWIENVTFSAMRLPHSAERLCK